MKRWMLFGGRYVRNFQLPKNENLLILGSDCGSIAL